MSSSTFHILNKKIFFKLTTIVYSVLLCFFISCKKEEVKQYAATEVYPEDSLLNSIKQKRAVIVLAHDDDMCAMSGTAAKLNSNGWEIGVISLSKTEARNQAQIKACRNILDTVMFVKLSHDELRNDLNVVENPYEALPKSKFSEVFNMPLIEQKYIELINLMKPSVVFTLDNKIGGYGHPEHVMVSQMVIDLAKRGIITPSYIYQSVYTDHMENSIMKRHSHRMKSWGFPGDGWENAKNTYMVDGMPEPTVQINIKQQATVKMDYLKSYNERERKTIGFFIPAFEDYSAEEYFEIFDREFFRVIDLMR